MKGLSLLLLLICYTTKTVSSYAFPNPLVYTKYGPILGQTKHSRKGREYMSFQAIPYAKPPVGELRFKAPEPVEPWSFALNATKDGPYCIQKNYFFADPKVEGSEDCLYLNVYTPKTETCRLLPVMVFIHWGGFFAGRGTSDIIGPEYFMDKDVILVTLNYRLGVFGFFSTLDDAAPGNFGLKDQVMALKFVNENIESFGGNRSQITLFGQSAGSGSTSLHMVSPASRDLFHQAITQSGVSLDLWAKPLNVLQPTIMAGLAAFTGCTDFLSDNMKLVSCLRDVKASDLAAVADHFKYFYTEPLTPYTVVTETKTDANPEPFLTKEPLEYLQSGDFKKVPWIVGNVQDEGILRVAPLTRQPEILRALNANFSTLITQMLFLQLSAGENASNLYADAADFYFGGNQSIDVKNPQSVQGFIDFYSDRAFVYGTYQAVILQAQKGHKPIWMYNFNYKGQYSYGDQFAATKEDIDFPWGVSHCDDLLYLFRTPALFPDLNKTTDLRMSDELLTLWTDFATFGNPDPHGLFNWTPLNFSSADEIKNANLDVLHIEGSLKADVIEYKMQKGYHTKRMAFWAKQNLLENFPGLS